MRCGSRFSRTKIIQNEPSLFTHINVLVTFVHSAHTKRAARDTHRRGERPIQEIAKSKLKKKKNATRRRYARIERIRTNTEARDKEDISSHFWIQMGDTKKNTQNTKDAVSEAGASAEATVKQTERHAHGGVEAIKELAENVAHKVHDVGEDVLRRADTAYHDAVGGAREAADVNDDGVVDEKDVKAVVDKCTSKCSVQ